MRGMGGAIRDFIKDAQEAGVEVPESMREIIQVAIDAGEVFDEDGKKITDMKDLGLTFGTTMETTMKKVGARRRSAHARARRAGEVPKDRTAERRKGRRRRSRTTSSARSRPVDQPVKYRDRGRLIRQGVSRAEAGEGARAVARACGPGAYNIWRRAASRAGPIPCPRCSRPASSCSTETSSARSSARAPVVVNLSIAIDGVFSEGDLVQTVQRRVAPILAQTIEDNVAGSRTRFQDVLGVT